MADISIPWKKITRGLPNARLISSIRIIWVLDTNQYYKNLPNY